MPKLFFLLFPGFFRCISSLKDRCYSDDSEMICIRDKSEEEALQKLETIAVNAFDNIPTINSDVEVIVDLLKREKFFPLHTLKNHVIVQPAKFTMNELQATNNFANLDSYSRRELENNYKMSYKG